MPKERKTPKSSGALTQELKLEILNRIRKWNEGPGKKFKAPYDPEFKGRHIYLKRQSHNGLEPVFRLSYSGNLEELDFAIFKWSSETYDADEWTFPGFEKCDGTLEGAMEAGMLAYPPSGGNSQDMGAMDFLEMLKNLMGGGKK